MVAIGFLFHACFLATCVFWVLSFPESFSQNKELIAREKMENGRGKGTKCMPCQRNSPQSCSLFSRVCVCSHTDMSEMSSSKEVLILLLLPSPFLSHVHSAVKTLLSLTGTLVVVRFSAGQKAVFFLSLSFPFSCSMSPIPAPSSSYSSPHHVTSTFPIAAVSARREKEQQIFHTTTSSPHTNV